MKTTILTLILLTVCVRADQYYSLQRPDYPPYPAPPKGLEVYQVEPGCFVFDDLKVNYPVDHTPIPQIKTSPPLPMLFNTNALAGRPEAIERKRYVIKNFFKADDKRKAEAMATLDWLEKQPQQERVPIKRSVWKDGKMTTYERKDGVLVEVSKEMKP